MKKLLLSCALLLASFSCFSDTLTIDGVGIATYTMQLQPVLLNKPTSRMFKVWCPATLNGVAVTAQLASTNTSNFPSEWLSQLAIANQYSSGVTQFYKDKPILTTSTSVAVPGSYVTSFVITRFGTIAQPLVATVTSTISCMAGTTIVPIAPLISGTILQPNFGYIEPIL